MMDISRKGTAAEGKSALAQGFNRLVRIDIDPETTDPHLLRQLAVLNRLIMISMALCVPLGILWALLVSPSFSLIYVVSFFAWGVVLCWLRRSQQSVLVGRVAVFILFALCTASIILLGGVHSNLLSWFILMPLAAAVCVDRRDVWYWGVFSMLAPLVFYFVPYLSTIAASPFSAEVNQQLSITALSSAALVVSILSGVWLGQHERLSQRLDDSVVRLKREAEAHRLVVETAMLASAETKLTTCLLYTSDAADE